MHITTQAINSNTPCFLYILDHSLKICLSFNLKMIGPLFLTGFHEKRSFSFLYFSKTVKQCKYKTAATIEMTNSTEYFSIIDVYGGDSDIQQQFRFIFATTSNGKLKNAVKNNRLRTNAEE